MPELARSFTRVLALLVAVLALGAPALTPSRACGAVVSSVPPGPRTAEPQSGASSLESAAARAGNTGRAVAMSLIGLAFAVAGTVLAFRRDFKEAAAVFAVGIIAVLLASAAGVSLLRDTVASLFGSR
jgi:hypothetical protein